MPYMPNNVNSIFALVLCLFGLTDAIAGSSSGWEAPGQIAKVRDNWLAAFKSKDVSTAISYYASDAAFLQPTGERIEGIETIRELYRKVASTQSRSAMDRRLLAAEAVAGVGHHVALSVVGTDRPLASGYFPRRWLKKI